MHYVDCTVSLGKVKGLWGILPDLVLGRSDPGKPLLPRPRIPYSKMLFPLSAAGVYLCYPDSCLHHADVKNALDEFYTATNTGDEIHRGPIFLEDCLWGCLESVDWTIFKYSVENLDEYATTVTDFINKCVEHCVPKKSIRVFPSQKPRMNQEIHSFLKIRRAAFKSDDPHLYRRSRYDLRKAIRDAKRQYRTKLEAQTNETASRPLWQALNSITEYKMKQNKIADKDTALPDALNAFYAQFEQNTSGAVLPALDAPAPTVTAAHVKTVFLRVNPRKATGPDGVYGRALRSCADQLAVEFTDVSSLSLLQAVVSTCFKKTTIILVFKKAHVVCLNDYCPVARTSVIVKCLERLI
eukprot:g37570.t1